jgi:hypothetical protein
MTLKDEGCTERFRPPKTRLKILRFRNEDGKGVDLIPYRDNLHHSPFQRKSASL